MQATGYVLFLRRLFKTELTVVSKTVQQHMRVLLVNNRP